MIECSDIEPFYNTFCAVGVDDFHVPLKIFYYYGIIKSIDEAIKPLKATTVKGSGS